MRYQIVNNDAGGRILARFRDLDPAKRYVERLLSTGSSYDYDDIVVEDTVRRVTHRWVDDLAESSRWVVD